MYLLFEPEVIYAGVTVRGAEKVLLVLLTVGDQGNLVLKEALCTPVMRFEMWLDLALKGPAINLLFPDKTEISKDNPANRATVEMLWQEESGKVMTHHSTLDLEYTRE